MKKLMMIIVSIICLFSYAFSSAEGIASSRDATYQVLFDQVLECTDSQGSGSASETLDIIDASVWKKTSTKAGFQFEGSTWDIFGECDMDTGIVTRIICKIPYNKGGLLLIYGITFCLSEESDAHAFSEKYVPDDAVLRNIPFPNYELTLNGGADGTFLFEYKRTTDAILSNSNAACPMGELISSTQK